MSSDQVPDEPLFNIRPDQQQGPITPPPDGSPLPTTHLLNPGGMTPDMLRKHDRVTIQRTISLEHYGDEPVQVRSAHWYLTDTQDEYYTRRYMTTGEEEPLYLGPFTVTPGLVILQNNAGRTERLPVESLREMELWVGGIDSWWFSILPGQCQDWRPIPGPIRIKGIKGIPYRIYLFPR